MKAYTTLEQSKKLAKILPHESADMCYIQDLLAGGKYGDYKPYIGDLIPAYGQGKIRCWSLAALLDVLPHRIDDRHALVSGKLSANEGWYVCYDDDNGDIDYYVHNSSLINACYEMILKLHEQNLL